MSTDETVLRELSSTAEPISGQELAERLHISRNSVWKAVKKLRESGYKIDAVTNRGYTLVSFGDALTAAGIKSRLPKSYRDIPIEVRAEVDSTNNVLKAIGEQNLAEEMVLIALSQTAGKGRLGRSFYSPADSGLYLSFLLRPKYSADEAVNITVMAAVAVSTAIEEISGQTAQIKWVNDIYVAGKKVCGILTEAAMDFESKGLNYAVLGIGVNIREPDGGFGPELEEIAGGIFQKEAPEECRARLAEKIIENFMDLYKGNDKDYIKLYREKSFLTGKRIVFHQGSIEERGTVLGIDGQARLLVRLDNNEDRAYSSGEIVLDKQSIKTAVSNGGDHGT